MSNTDKVREQIAKIIAHSAPSDNPDDVAAQILSIPSLCIEAEDQSLPQNPYQRVEFSPVETRWDTFQRSQSDMRKAGFVKVERKKQADILSADGMVHP